MGLGQDLKYQQETVLQTLSRLARNVSIVGDGGGGGGCQILLPNRSYYLRSSNVLQLVPAIWWILNLPRLDGNLKRIQLCAIYRGEFSKGLTTYKPQSAAILKGELHEAVKSSTNIP